MAEQAPAAAEAEPGAEHAPDIDALQAEADRKVEPRTIEDFARERGWKPKEEFVGEEADYRDAEAFLAFGLDRTSDLRKDVRRLSDTTERMSRTQADIMQQAVQRARDEERARWETAHARAVEDGDIPGATAAVKKIAELSAPAAQPQNGQAQDSPAVAQFRADNSWFDTNPTARAVAIAESVRLAGLGKTEAEQLQAAREEVHKRFPEYAPARAKPAASVAAPAGRVAGTAKKGGKGFADMPAEAQEAARALAQRGFATLDGYAKQYWNPTGEVG